MSKDEEIFQPNDVSVQLVVPRKRGRPPKSKCSLISSVSPNPRRNSSRQSTSKKIEIQSKELKLFPIFNSPSTTSNRNNIEHANKANEKCKPACSDKRRKSETTKVNNVVSTVEKNAHKSSIKSSKSKRTKLGKNSDLKSCENKTDNLTEPEVIINEHSTSSETEAVKIAGFCNSDPPNIDLAVSEAVQYVCLKAQQIVDCDDITVLSYVDHSARNKLLHDVKDDCISNGNKLKRKRKSKRNASIKINVPNNDILETEDTSEVSSRRRSLRSGGIRSNFINYSEVNSFIDIPEKHRKGRSQASKHSENRSDGCVLINEGTSECSEDECIISSEVREKSENVEESLKFFPVFTSNKTSSDRTNTNRSSNKRKTLCNEVHIENNINNPINASNKNICPKKKKTRDQSNIDESDNFDKSSSLEHNDVTSACLKDVDEDCKILSSDLSYENVKNGCNERLIDSCKKTKYVDENARSKEFDDFTISDATIKIGKEQCENKSEKDNKSDSQVLKKSNKSDIKNICFPKLSHLNVYNESLLDTVSKFQIHPEDSTYSITVPVWNEVKGFIDVDCAKVIKSLQNKHDTEKKSVDVISVSSNIAVNESDEDNIVWTDFVENTVMKEMKNKVTVNEVKSWLLQWKDKFCKNSETKTSHSDSERYSTDSDSDDDFVSNSIIIYGAPGSGKTSLVFSLANELGFTVLEVNASTPRSGRSISHQLKEALESYHVESIKIDNAFESVKIDNAFESAKLETRKETKRKCTSDLEESKFKTKNIKSFFGVGNKDIQKKNGKSDEKKQGIDSFFLINNSDKKPMNSKRKNGSKKTNKSQTKSLCDRNVEEDNYLGNLKSDKNSCRISSSTIILFDDVDIVFEEDEGFWSTVKGFLKISKKPVIFTVGRNLSIVKNILNSDIQIFNMKPTSRESAMKTLETYCRMNSREDTTTDLELLTSQNLSDVRRNILNAQFWTKNPKSHNDGLLSVMNDSYVNHAKFIHINNFIVGDLNFSADHIRKLLFDYVPYYFSNAVTQYQSLGYDVLYSNLFYILSILDSMKYEKVWKTVSNRRTCNSTKSFSDSQMWEEACEIFKRKKKALKNGSCSEDLNLFSNMVEDFSFADMLKGLSSNKFQWISVSERIKMWTAGLPMCCDHTLWPCEDILQIVSLIHIYALRKLQNVHISEFVSSNNNDLILEHPFITFDQAFAYNAEEDLTCVSTALPVSQQLNKMALTLDYLSMIKIMCQDEESRQLNSGKRSGRFLHYFDSISFLMDKRTF